MTQDGFHQEGHRPTIVWSTYADGAGHFVGVRPLWETNLGSWEGSLDRQQFHFAHDSHDHCNYATVEYDSGERLRHAEWNRNGLDERTGTKLALAKFGFPQYLELD